MIIPVYVFFFPLGEYFRKGHRYRKGGGEGGGQILPAATLNVNNFFLMFKQIIRYFYRNLFGDNLLWLL